MRKKLSGKQITAVAAGAAGVTLIAALPSFAQVSGTIQIQVGQPQPPATIIYTNPVPNGIYSYPSSGSIIYGSPIPSPIPVNPVTGTPSNLPSIYSYPSYPSTTLVNPTLVNPSFPNSVLVNPTIVTPSYSRPIYVPPARGVNINIGF